MCVVLSLRNTLGMKGKQPRLTEADVLIVCVLGPTTFGEVCDMQKAISGLKLPWSRVLFVSSGVCTPSTSITSIYMS